MNNLLITGKPGSGKNVVLNGILSQLASKPVVATVANEATTELLDAIRTADCIVIDEASEQCLEPLIHAIRDACDRGASIAAIYQSVERIPGSVFQLATGSAFRNIRLDLSEVDLASPEFSSETAELYMLLYKALPEKKKERAKITAKAVVSELVLAATTADGISESQRGNLLARLGVVAAALEG